MSDTGELGLADWASRHHGLFRASDALRFGLSRRQIAYRVQQGRAERIGVNVYRMAGSPRTADQEVLGAAWRASGPGSHLTAAQMGGLLDRPPRRPHVTVGAASGHSLNGVVIHRSTDLRPTDLTTVRNTPITNAARTLVDIGCLVRRGGLERALHRALHRRLTTVDELASTYAAVSRRGRNGAGPIGELLESYDGTMAAAESDLEVVILQVLETYGVRPPVRQHPAVVEGERFRLDLAYPDAMVFLEGDGFGVHGGRSAFEDDRWRQNLLVLHGWWPIRFTWRQVHDKPAACAALIDRKLAETASRRA